MPQRFLVPLLIVVSLVPSLWSGQEESRGFLGVRMEVRHENGGGVYIKEVVAKSPAEKAGLKVGDYILRVANVEARNSEVVIETIGAFRPGDRIAVEITRGDREMILHAVLTDRPKDP